MIRQRGRMICMTCVKADLVRHPLPSHEALSRAEPGCLSFYVSETEDPLVFDVHKSCRTRADFDAHQARTRASPWFDATRAILRDYRVEEPGDGSTAQSPPGAA